MARMGLAARGRRRPPTGRQEEIARVGRAARVGGQGQERRQLPGGELPRVPPKRMPTPGAGPELTPGGRGGRLPGRGRQAGQGGPGVAGARKAGLPIGDQLQRRVKSGAITGEQAQRTARERQTLKKKFGSDWREELPGGAGAFRKARAMLAKNPDNAKLIALNKRLQGKRQQLLEAARGNGGAAGENGGTTAPGGAPAGRRGKVNPRGRGMMNPPGQGPARRRRRRKGGYVPEED